MKFFEGLRRTPPSEEERRRHEEANANLLAAAEEHNAALGSYKAAEAGAQAAQQDAEVRSARSRVRLEFLPLLRAQAELQVNLEMMQAMPSTAENQKVIAELLEKIAEINTAVAAAEDEAERKIR